MGVYQEINFLSDFKKCLAWYFPGFLLAEAAEMYLRLHPPSHSSKTGMKFYIYIFLFFLKNFI